MSREDPFNRDDSPRRRGARAHRKRVGHEVERRIINSNSNYVRFFGLLLFGTRCLDTLRPLALADVGNEGALQGHRRPMGIPDHHTSLARKRLCEQVFGGCDR